MSIRLPAQIALLLLLPTAAFAQLPYSLRTPQIPVQGRALQDFFVAASETLDVQRDQLDAELMQFYRAPNSSYTIQIECAAKDADIALGLYDGSSLTPLLAQVFPVGAGPGWFAVASFRFTPVRVVVNLFDADASLQGTSTYLGGNAGAIGFYAQSPNGVIYSQDARNPGGAAQVLFYEGQASAPTRADLTWIAFESSARASGADGDFDDAILFLEQNVFVGAVQKTTWRGLKDRFR